MARTSVYLNFPGNTEEAFEFYRSIFGGELTALMRFSEMPADPSMPPLPDDVLPMLVHVELTILGGTVLMGTDSVTTMGHEVRYGNNVTLNLEPDSLEETERLFAALSEGGTDVSPLTRMFWGAHWATCRDRFGVRWMFNFTDNEE